MLHVFHGEKLEDAYKEIDLLKEKLKVSEIVDLDGKKMTATDLIQATESNSLFIGQRLVIVRNYLAKFRHRQIKELKIQIERIPSSAEVVFIENTEVSKSVLNLFPKNTDIAVFRPDRLIFKLLESIGTRDPKDVYYLLEECLKLEPAEFIFSMLIRHYRLLLMVKNKQLPRGLLSWQVSRLRNQASKFTQHKLQQIYRKLLEIDYGIKSGINDYPLEKQLPQLVLFNT